jgi:Zn-dependent peptidase ImmA (M78 family)
LNQSLRADPARLKFDLATHIGHKVLHGGDGMKSPHATGGEMGGSPESGSENAGLRAQDVLHAWRDFECSFFAGALLCPKIPFRRFLARNQYRIEPATALELTPAVVMRRMTKVSPYPTGTSSMPIRPATCARSIAATASRCPGATWRRSAIHVRSGRCFA